jgi:riboflavin kinase/FMN adenylyltransferase
MSFRQQLASATPGRETVLAIGVFDGVHRGHRHVLQRLCQLARPRYLPGVVTFINHPLPVLRPGAQVSYITTPEEKVRLLREQGVELVVSLEFTQELSQVSARDFTTMLVDLLRMKGLVMGPDSTLGHNRQGDVSFLRKLGEELGFWVETAEPLLLDGERIRSRRVREAVQGGDVEKGCRLLGRHFSLGGSVVRGAGRGRELGFPTANLAVDAQMVLPADGIYATWAIIAGKRHPSATSIGVRPTFGLTERLVEVYVMDFDADLYGREMRVEFVRKLRDQETFSTVAALVNQINRDVADARLALAHPGLL